jgi:tetratricopeptide (TPR) repeat protein
LARLESTAARIALAEGDLKRARTTARSAASSAAQLQLVDVLCETLETQGRAALRSGDLDAALAAFEQMEELARTGGLTLQLIRALVELGTIDHLTRAQPGRLREAERLAVRKGAVFALARVDLELAWMHLGLAQLDEARRAVDHCLDSCRGFGLPLLGQALVAQTALHALGGRGAEMERAGSEALGAAVGDSEIEAAILGNGGAVLRIVLGEEDRALADLELALVALERAANRQPWWFHGLWTLLRSGGEDGRAARDALRDDPVLANPANRGYLAYADAHAAGADGRHVEAEAAFNGADALMPPGWRRHHARLVVGEKALAAGWGDPGAWAGEALAFAESTGMDWLAGRARAVMRQAGLRVPRRRRGRDRAPASAY